MVGLSGGVDSSLAAYLLKEQGYEVIGMFMRNWHDDSVILDDECPWIEDSNDALLVAEQLGIPFQVIDLSQVYRERIVDYMFAEYEAGRTPNPDVLCNREIKFDVFLEAALRIGADFVATGHYCRKRSFQQDGKTIYQLIAGADSNKDQSYFLCQVSQEQLSKALFPIGELQKSEVRRMAEEQGLATARKKDSQGLCFIGKVRLPDFLQQQLKPKRGDIVEVAAQSAIFEEQPVPVGAEEAAASLPLLTRPYRYKPTDGQKVGEHNGAHYFTIGQRKGLGVGGKAEALFVIGTDVATNTVYVGQGAAHPGLYRSGLFVPNTDLHWLRPDLRLLPGQSATYRARIRYRQPLSAVSLHATAEGVYFLFEKPQRGVTPGQFVAWYEGEELIGSGVIA